MDRIGEDPQIRGEDAVGAVALMCVGIQDEDPLAGPGEVLLADGDGDVIEYAGRIRGQAVTLRTLILKA